MLPGGFGNCQNCIWLFHQNNLTALDFEHPLSANSTSSKNHQIRHPLFRGLSGLVFNKSIIDIDWLIVGGLALGGCLMAPIAARIVVALPRKQIGILVGIAVIVINGYRILAG